MDSELMIPYFSELGLLGHLDLNALQECSRLAARIFI
jgi:hypothetical protein